MALDLLTGIDLPYELKGQVSSPAVKLKAFNEQWYPGDTCNLSIGQGFTLITPIANLVAMNVFATKGYIVRPHLLKKIGEMESGLNKRYYLGIDPKSLGIIRTALINVVDEEGGTAGMLKPLGFDIAGKTGTAQAAGGASHGWFVGFFPYEAPRYSVCVLLEHGGSSYEALKVLYDFLKKTKEENLLTI
jgi:penicillin-binding protein 2